MNKTELVSEGHDFATQFPHFTNDKGFMNSILQAFNEDLDKEETLKPSEVAKHFSVMHGYLNMAYIHGFAMDSDPEWAGCREASWTRWVEYLRHVEGMPWSITCPNYLKKLSAQDFAKRFFYAVDSVHAYT